jgi:peptide-methionine (S)-S-oxide reductase
MPVNDEQESVAKESIQSFKDVFSNPIVTTIEPALNLIVAEVYHHDYYARNPTQGYCQMVVGPKISKVRRKLSHLYENTE